MEAYIIAAYRTAVGKAPRGVFRFTRADDLAAEVVRHLVASIPNLDKEEIDDVIVGNATPEGEQGLNVGRMISLMGLNTEKVPGITVNRYCASGLETIATAVAKIRSGMADCIIAGGVEVMSGMPFGGWKLVPNAEVAKNNPDWYWGMGLTAEAVAKEYNVSREDQDEFAFNSHRKAVEGIKNGHLKDGIVPITVKETYLDENLKKKTKEYIVDTDEGPRADTTPEKLARLKPVFAAEGVSHCWKFLPNIRWSGICPGGFGNDAQKAECTAYCSSGELWGSGGSSTNYGYRADRSYTTGIKKSRNEAGRY